MLWHHFCARGEREIGIKGRMRAEQQSASPTGWRTLMSYENTVEVEISNDMIASSEIHSFESVALPHLDDIFRTAWHVMGSRIEAEDLAQETYLQAWKSFHRFEPGTNCRAWMYKILFHVIHHHRRKWFKFNLVKDGEDMLERTLVYEPPVRQDLSDEEVLSAFQKIPQAFREVVLLADVEEFSYKEVASTLGIPVGTVMSRLSRGRKLLRIELAAFAETFGIRADVEKAHGVGA